MTHSSLSSQKIPKLRFREFQSEWEEKKLREYTTLITKGTTPKSFGKGNVNYVKIECFEKNKIIKDRCSLVEEEVHKKELKRSILQVGDILFAIAGATIGKCGIVTNDILPANTNQALAIIRLNQDSNGEYIFHILRSEIMGKYIKDNLTAGAQPNLNLEQMGSFSFYSSSLPEQTKIASFLSSVDTHIEQLREKKSLLEVYKKGVMQKIFAREIRFRDENGEEYPEWEEKKLGDLCKIKTGKKDVNEGNPDGQYPFFTCAKTHTYSDFYSFDCDAILIAGNGEVGHCQRYSGKFEAYQRTYVLSDFSEDINYLYCHLNSTFQDVISSQKQMGAMPYIKLGMLTDFMIPIPSLPEQIKIASFLSEIDSKIQSTTEQLEEAEKWKTGLLQGMFV